MMDKLARAALPPLCRFQKRAQKGREQGASDRAVGRWAVGDVQGWQVGGEGARKRDVILAVALACVVRGGSWPGAGCSSGVFPSFVAGGPHAPLRVSTMTTESLRQL